MSFLFSVHALHCPRRSTGGRLHQAKFIVSCLRLFRMPAMASAGGYPLQCRATLYILCIYSFKITWCKVLGDIGWMELRECPFFLLMRVAEIRRCRAMLLMPTKWPNNVSFTMHRFFDGMRFVNLLVGLLTNYPSSASWDLPCLLVPHPPSLIH